MRVDDRDNRFKEWLRDPKGLIFKVVHAFATAAEDQDDLFQEIAFQLWSSIPSYRGKAKTSTWIYKVALNTVLAWQRNEKKHRPQRDLLIDEIEEPDHARERSGSAENREILEWLYAEIHKLPKVDRTLILLYLDDLSYHEMAEILGISESNVGVKLNRIKKRLTEAMQVESYES